MPENPFLWRCPKCHARSRQHGRGECASKIENPEQCNGFLCECELFGCDDSWTNSETHGRMKEKACKNAKCDHCGWHGTYPADGLQFVLGSIDDSWEAKALANGWTPPSGWKGK